MRLTAAELRENIDHVLDEVLDTGVPVEIEHNGRTLRIVADEAPSRLGRRVRRPSLVTGESEDLVHMDWSSEWRP